MTRSPVGASPSSSRSAADVVATVPPCGPAVVGRPEPDDAERARQMAEFSITWNGRHFRFDRYRYDRLSDAVAYARLVRTRSGTAEEDLRDEQLSSPETVEVPDEAQQRQMAALGITYDTGVYRLGPYRYDRLADALRQSRHAAGDAGDGPDTAPAASPPAAR